MLILIAIFIAVWAAFFIGISAGILLMKAEAVESGLAEYYLDGNNQRKWRWNTPPTDQQPHGGGKD